MIILDKPQAELLRSFLIGHSKEIENSEHADAMLEIMKDLREACRNKATIFVGKIANYEIVLGTETRGFAILFNSPIKTQMIAEWVGRKVKITFEEEK